MHYSFSMATHQLAQSEIAAILNQPDVKSGDARTFQSFALRVHLLVSMLLSLEGPQGMELNCCSHVDRVLSKLPKYHRDGFIEYLQMQGKLNTTSLNPYNLQDLNGWLQGKAQQQRLSSRLVQRYQLEKPASNGREKIPFTGRGQSIAVYHGAEPIQPSTTSKYTSAGGKKPFKVHCLFCDSKEHYISRCPSIKVTSTTRLDRWITDGKRCWKCARAHAPESCNLKKPCSDWQHPSTSAPQHCTVSLHRPTVKNIREPSILDSQHYLQQSASESGSCPAAQRF